MIQHRNCDTFDFMDLAPFFVPFDHRPTPGFLEKGGYDENDLYNTNGSISCANHSTLSCFFRFTCDLQYYDSVLLTLSEFEGNGH